MKIETEKAMLKLLHHVKKCSECGRSLTKYQVHYKTKEYALGFREMVPVCRECLGGG